MPVTVTGVIPNQRYRPTPYEYFSGARDSDLIKNRARREDTGHRVIWGAGRFGPGLKEGSIWHRSVTGEPRQRRDANQVPARLIADALVPRV